jgi:anti-sigma factor RsiW
MMKCAQALPLLSAYLDQELSVNEMRQVAAHLEACRSCEAELRRLEGTKAFLGTLASPQPRRDFWMEAYERLERIPQRPVPFWQRLTLGQRSAMVLAPLVVVASVLTFFSFQPAPGPDSSQLMDDLIQAHLEARTSQPLADQSHVRMLLVDYEDSDIPMDNE